MHVKYKLRKPDGLVIPKGPDFAHAQTFHCDFSGTKLSFKAPKHRTNKRMPDEVLPKQRYDLETISRYFRTYGDDHRETPNHLEYYELFQRYWEFYGPWFTGVQSELQMYIALIMPVNFDNKFSLFHPRAFESFIADYLKDLYGKSVNPVTKGNSYVAPISWQPITRLPLAARLEVVPTPGDIVAGARQTHVYFTVSHNIIANVQFNMHRMLNLPQEELDKRVSVAPMYELMNNIIDSFHLDLSGEAKQQQKAALEGLDDPALVKDYPPLDWSGLIEAPKTHHKKLEKES